MNGYKIFDKNFCCRGLQYRVGETLKHEGPIELCKSGLHFCTHTIDCLRYYYLTRDNRYAEVRAVGQVITKDDKSATDALMIVREIPYEEFRDMCTGVIIKYRGSIKMETHYKNGVMNGVSRKWFPSEQMEREWHYVDGELSGVCQDWYANGQLYSYCEYIDGKLIKGRMWDIDGIEY